MFPRGRRVFLVAFSVSLPPSPSPWLLRFFFFFRREDFQRRRRNSLSLSLSLSFTESPFPAHFAPFDLCFSRTRVNPSSETEAATRARTNEQKMNHFSRFRRKMSEGRPSPRVSAGCVCFMFFNICNLSIKL